MKRVFEEILLIGSYGQTLSKRFIPDFNNKLERDRFVFKSTQNGRHPYAIKRVEVEDKKP